MIEIESTVQIWKKRFKSLDLFCCFFALTVSSNKVFLPGRTGPSFLSISPGGSKNSAATQQLSARYYFRFWTTPCTIILRYLKYASNGSYIAREITRHVHQCDCCISATNIVAWHIAFANSLLIYMLYVQLYHINNPRFFTAAQPLCFAGVSRIKSSSRERQRNWVIFEHLKPCNFLSSSLRSEHTSTCWKFCRMERKAWEWRIPEVLQLEYPPYESI